MKSTYNEILHNMKAAYNKELGREIAENSIDENAEQTKLILRKNIDISEVNYVD